MTKTGTIARHISLLILILLAFSGPRCFADLSSGSIHGQGGGMTAVGTWDSTDTLLSWSVVLDSTGNFYTYTYTFTVPGKALSHFILEVSDTFDLMGFDEEGLVNTSLDPEGLDAFLDTYSGTGDNKPNPGMPGDIYGLKFENDEDPLTDEYFGDSTTWMWSFNSLREPVWGDFYAVDGYDQASSAYPYAYNTSFGIPYSGDPSGYIAVPDTTVIPVPSAILLGILGMGAAGVKLRKFA